MAAGQWSPLQPLQKLFDIEAADGAVVPDERSGSGECLRQSEWARTRRAQNDGKVAASGKFAGAEQFTGTALQIDIHQLELCLDVGGDIVTRNAERALGDTAEDLRFRHAEGQRAVAQVGAERCAAQFG